MLFFLLFFLLLLLFFIHYFFDNIISKVVATAFIGYWGLSLLLSYLNVYDLYPVQINTYAFFMVAMISFVLGMFCIKPKKILCYECAFEIRTQIEYFLSKKIIPIVLLCCVFYLSKYALLALSLSSLSGKGAMQSDYVSTMLKASPFFGFMYGIVMTAIFHMVCPLLMYMILNFKKKYLFHLFSCVLFLVFYAIINGGRSIFIILMLYLLITYTCTSLSPSFKINFKKILIGLFIAAFVLVGIAIMTQYRSTGRFVIDSINFKDALTEASEKIGVYSTIPFVLFDHAIQNDYFNFFGGPFWGRATFSGLDIYITAILKIFGFDIENTNVIITHYLQETWVPVRPKGSSNYAYSGLLQHYLDFGLFGIFFFPFIFGVSFQKIIDLFLRYRNVWLFAFLSFSFFIAIHSIFTCYFIKNWIYWYLLFLLIMFGVSVLKKR